MKSPYFDLWDMKKQDTREKCIILLFKLCFLGDQINEDGTGETRVK
jgi:hypothetical protein